MEQGKNAALVARHMEMARKARIAGGDDSVCQYSLPQEDCIKRCRAIAALLEPQALALAQSRRRSMDHGFGVGYGQGSGSGG